VSILAAPSPALANGPHRTTCERVEQEVTLTSSSPTTYTVVGQLCGPRRASTVQLLNSGFTYGSYYWDLPFQPERYSYVRAAYQAGFATLNIDRIGVGQSDKPPADQVTVTSEAWVDAQLARALRKGQIGRNRPRFAHVVGVGHSLGGMIITVSQATYRPFDAIVANGTLHANDMDTVVTLGTIRHSAADDPKFQNAELPADYVTTIPGKRSAYYDTRFADPRVIRQDERLKQTATSGEVATIGAGRDPSYSQRVTVPTLLWIGQTDSLNCNESLAGLSCASVSAIRAREIGPWSATRCLGVYIQPRSGHDTNLHRSAPWGFVAVNTWLTQMGFGPRHHHTIGAQGNYARCA
jgi:pimeloyl-ACP methyl ester carboxylesterase